MTSAEKPLAKWVQFRSQLSIRPLSRFESGRGIRGPLSVVNLNINTFSLTISLSDTCGSLCHRENLKQDLDAENWIPSRYTTLPRFATFAFILRPLLLLADKIRLRVAALFDILEPEPGFILDLHFN